MLQLQTFPGEQAGAPNSISAMATWDPSGRMHFDYVLEGGLDLIAMAGPDEPARVDGLWQTTCFEAFVGVPNKSSYFEFNFSPAGLWAAYYFADYRDGMSAPPLSPAPVIDLRQRGDALLVSVHVELRKFVELEFAEALECNLSAVIEEKSGEKSHWALAHADTAPDFHSRDCFVLELTAPSAG